MFVGRLRNHSPEKPHAPPAFGVALTPSMCSTLACEPALSFFSAIWVAVSELLFDSLVHPLQEACDHAGHRQVECQVWSLCGWQNLTQATTLSSVQLFHYFPFLHLQLLFLPTISSKTFKLWAITQAIMNYISKSAEIKQSFR